MAKNDFQPFAIGTGANVTSQEDYVSLAALVSGFQSGKASSAQINKVLRQATFVASALAQFVSDNLAQDVLDDGELGNFKQQLISALGAQSLETNHTRKFTSSGSWTCPDGVTTVYLTGCGGGAGGAGGGAASPTAGTSRSAAGGGGGGAGQSAIKVPVTVVPGTTYTVTVAAASPGASGGTVAGAQNGTSSAAGGTTSFGSLLTLSGGAAAGGGTGAANGAPSGGVGGAPGGQAGQDGTPNYAIPVGNGGNGGIRHSARLAVVVRRVASRGIMPLPVMDMAQVVVVAAGLMETLLDQAVLAVAVALAC